MKERCIHCASVLKPGKWKRTGQYTCAFWTSYKRCSDIQACTHRLERKTTVLKRHLLVSLGLMDEVS